MKKELLNLGKALNRAEQRVINGGKEQCNNQFHCGEGKCCNTAGWCQSVNANTGYLCAPYLD